MEIDGEKVDSLQALYNRRVENMRDICVVNKIMFDLYEHVRLYVEKGESMADVFASIISVKLEKEFETETLKFRDGVLESEKMLIKDFNALDKSAYPASKFDLNQDLFDCIETIEFTVMNCLNDDIDKDILDPLLSVCKLSALTSKLKRIKSDLHVFLDQLKKGEYSMT